MNSSLKFLAMTTLVFFIALRANAQAPAGARGTPPPSGPGPGDKQGVDTEAADRGKTTYIAECITCHGPRARGTDGGPDLVRSLVVLRDRYGSELASFLRKGHPTQRTPTANFTAKQVEDLSHFLKQRFNETLRSSPTYRVQNVLTGNARAGADYFNGAGKCVSCHSTTGNLAGIGKKYDPPTLQQRFLFPQRTKPVAITVTPATGPAVSGTLVRIDDFDVSLRDGSGEYRSWKRTRDLKIERSDPYSAHVDLLDK